MRRTRSVSSQLAAKQISPLGLAAFLVFLILSASLAFGLQAAGWPDWASGGAAIVCLLPGLYILFALRMANEWEKAVVLRAGKFMGLRGPGLFWLVPVLDSIPVWIDHRVMVTPFNAEKTLTKDTVPVDVDAVLFWLVWDAQKAALEVEDYRAAIGWAAQTALRDIIGKMVLADILVGRDAIDHELQRVIDERTTPWGVSVSSVEIRDTPALRADASVIIPQELEDAMSRQAQAERERQARVILGESERQIASSFAEASQFYIGNPPRPCTCGR